MTPEQWGTEWRDAMLLGDFERAWQTSDRIRAAGTADPHRLWQGEPFVGRRVMVRCLHGFGDSVQFLRYTPQLRQVAATVCVEVAPGFVELARQFQGVDHVITWGEGAPESNTAWDVQMEVTELPYIFRTQLSDLPGDVGYLQASPSHHPIKDGILRVGLVWTAGHWNPQRAMPFKGLEPLLAVAGCEFWNLTTEPAPHRLREDLHCRESVAGLAARIAALDLVITVDTLAAHVAGALGVPAWIMLQQDCDWRWMRHRPDSPWYPSVRLFRQREERVWNDVIQRVKEALEERVYGQADGPGKALGLVRRLPV